MSLLSIMEKLLSYPHLDKTVANILLTLLVAYPLYYVVIFLLTALLHFDLYKCLIIPSYLLILSIALSSIVLPFATKHASRSKKYIFISLVSLFIVVPILICFESFIRIEWSFGR